MFDIIHQNCEKLQTFSTTFNKRKSVLESHDPYFFILDIHP